MTNPFEQFNSSQPEPANTTPSAGGNAFSAFSGGGVTMDEEEQKVVGEVNAVKVQTPETFGLTRIPKDVGKGIAREILSVPQDIGATLVEAGENAKASTGETAFQTAKRSFMTRLINQDPKHPLSVFGLIMGVEKDVALNLAFDSEGANVVVGAGYNMIKENQRDLESMGLVPKGKPGMAYDVGQGLASVFKSVGLLALTKNPTIAGAHMAWVTNSRDYLEARKSGKDPEDSAAIAATSAAGQGAIEVIGGKYFMAAAKGSSFIKTTLQRLIGQAGEETAQSGVEVTVKNVSGVRDQSLEDALMEMAYSGLIGAIAGAPVSAVTTGLENYGKSLGVPDKMAKETAVKIADGYADLQDMGAALIDKETTGLGTDRSVTDAAITASKEAINTKELELTAQAEEKVGAEKSAQQEVDNEVATVAENVDGAVDGIKQAVQQIPETVEPRVVQALNDRLTALERKKESLNIGDFQRKGGMQKIRVSLEAIDQDIAAIHSELVDMGVDPVTLGNVKFNQRAMQKSVLQAERVAGRNERAQVAQAEAIAPDQQKQVDYDVVASGIPASRLARAKKGTKDVGAGIVELGSDIFTPVSTRLGKINSKLKTAVRKYTFNTGMHNAQDKRAIKPFVDGLSNMEAKDYRMLDFALKNKDQAKVDEILGKYKLQDDFKEVQKTLDDIFDEAKEVGLDLNYIEQYFPRQVKRDMVAEYLAVLRGREDWSEIQVALSDVDPENIYSDAEKADFINNYLRGFTSKRILLSPSGFTKERTVDYVTPELNRYYESSPTALIRYVDGMRFGIEARRLFGKDKAEGSIGDYVRQLVEEGSIDSKNEEEVKKILKSLVDQQGTRGVVTWAKNASYIYVMGSPLSAITQIGDLAFSMVENGYYNTGISLGRAILRKSNITKEDIGIEHIIQEFDGESASARAVRKVFKLVGLEYMDNIGKEVAINSALLRLQKQAKLDTPEFQAYMEDIFGAEAKQTAKDLADGVASENVKFLLFSELSDVQPISLAEMPVNYLRSGNGRVFYMLKTYTLKLLDIHRRKWFDEIASGDPKRMAVGARNLVQLSVALLIMGMATDVIKDLLMGKDFEPDDLLMDNIIKLAGVSRYQIYKSKTDGVMNAFWQTLFVPPVGAPIDDLSKDIPKIGFGNKKLKDAETLKGIPVGGKLYYWWLGGGKTKSKKKHKNTSSTL